MSTSVSGQKKRARAGLWGTSDGPFECHTARRAGQSKSAAAALALLVATTAAGPAGDAGPAPWPSFLGPRETWGPDVVAAVERIWREPTLQRRVRGRPARVPLEVYAAFVDAPEVTAAAGRFLGLARYEAEALGGDWYRATDHDGAHGTYRVLVRDTRRRVMLSWGRHAGPFLGTISGSAVTVLELQPGAAAVEQSLDAWVHIDQAVAATLARLLIPLFGWLADRKLAESIGVASRVAEWAGGNPAVFCRWLADQAPPPARRERFAEVFPACR